MDLIIQNNSDKRIWLLSGLTDTSDTHLYAHFEDVEMPDDAPNGEYFYALIGNDRNDVSYTFKTDLLSTIVTVGDDNFELRDLSPATGLLRIGDVVDNAVYQPKDNKTYYYKK